MDIGTHEKSLAKKWGNSLSDHPYASGQWQTSEERLSQEIPLKKNPNLPHLKEPKALKNPNLFFFLLGFITEILRSEILLAGR